MWQSKITDATVRQEIGGRILSVAPPPRLGLNPDFGPGMKPVIESDSFPRIPTLLRPKDGFMN